MAFIPALWQHSTPIVVLNDLEIWDDSSNTLYTIFSIKFLRADDVGDNVVGANVGQDDGTAVQTPPMHEAY